MDKNRKEYARWVKDGGRTLQYTFEGMHPESIVFDVGMYRGDWSSEISQRYNPYIFGFEPVSTFYKIVKDRFKLNPKITIRNYGLGHENRQDTIVVNRDSSSLFRKGSNMECITIKDVHEEFVSLDLEKIDLLALNCEGSEYEILQRLLSTGAISKFERLFVQFHFIRDGDQILHKNLVRELAKTHIQKYCYLSIWELWTKK